MGKSKEGEGEKILVVIPQIIMWFNIIFLFSLHIDVSQLM
jgi:hypothetical protein